MINNLFKITFFLLLSNFVNAQVAPNKQIHDKASENISDVLFDSKAKAIREKAKAFENASGIKIQFKVEEQSLDKLGGLSEHLFRLFQNFTTNENTNAKTITAEFSAISDKVLSDVLTYKTNVTHDLANCVMPPNDTQKLDSLYNKSLHGNPLSSEEMNTAPASLDGIYSQSMGDYESILYKNSNCPGTVDESSYMQQVINTRQNRYSSWTSDVNALSLNISIDYGLLSSDTSSSNNNNPFQGKHIINLNNSVNSCTQEDMESRCRMLFGKTHKRFLFVTQTINYYLPLDSLSAFRDAATQTFSNNSTDEVIIALYLNMKSSAAEKSTALVLVKQVNGDWLTAGDINFANHNNGGKYSEGTFYKFKNIYKNIPKPLVLCYQVAKVNGLLTTAYFNKGAVVKGREQIYYHIFKVDKALDDIKQLEEQRKTKIAAIGNANNWEQALSASDQIDEIVNKIKITYLEAAKNPTFREAGEHFKDRYVQKKETAEAAALQYLKESYGTLYPNNQIETLIANVGLPTDVKIGSCKTSDNSDVIADGLNIASLVLSPTGLDFIPDALAVAYFASTDNTIEMFWASASFIVPGSLSGARKIVSNSADVIKEINAGSKLLIESQQLKVIEQDVNYITAAFNIKPQDVDASLLGKIRNNPTVTSNLLPITSAQAKVYSNTEKLAAPKRVEFVKKCYDDPSFRQKVLADPDEVLRWGGIVELIRGVSKTDFLSSVTEFAGNPQLGEQAWNYFKNENWNQLENLFKNNNLNKYNDIIYPPNNGAINIVKKTLDPKDYPVDLIIDRYGSTAGKFTAPVNTPFPERALPSTFESQTPQKYKVLKPITNVEEGQIIPWFNQPGMGLQYKLEKSVQYYIDEGFLLPIN